MKLRPREIDAFWARVDQSAGPKACWPWKLSVNGHGYGQFYVRRVSASPESAHRIAFILSSPESFDPTCVLHTCDTPACCNPAHLFAGTQLDNMRDMHFKGRGAIGARHYRAKLSAARVAAMRRLTRKGRSIRDLAAQFGVERNAAACAIRGLTWRAVEEPPVLPQRHSRARLTAADVRGIRQRWGCSPRPAQALLAEAYGVSVPTISLIVRRKTWAEV